MTDAATQEIPLAADFPARTHEEWQGLVAAVLNKSRTPETALTGPAAEESMRSHLLGGLQVDPIYLRPADRHPLGMPGQAPFTRGRAVRDTSMPWDVRALHDDPDPAVTRSAVLADLERGVTSIWLHVGTDGIAPAVRNPWSSRLTQPISCWLGSHKRRRSWCKSPIRPSSTGTSSTKLI